MKLINKLICKIKGHKFIHYDETQMICERCGSKRDKTEQEKIFSDTLFAQKLYKKLNDSFVSTKSSYIFVNNNLTI